MPNLKKQERCKRVIAYLQAQLKSSKSYLGQDLDDQQKKRIDFELDRLLNPKAKSAKKTESSGPVDLSDRWYIDIYSVKYGYMKNSERRKNKGKARKKMKKVKTLSLLKTVVAQTGMITAYKEGRMGVSPKSHAFKMRKEEIYNH